MKKMMLSILLTSVIIPIHCGKLEDTIRMLKTENDSQSFIYLLRSGGFDQPFIDNVNTIPLREIDKVARCKKTDGNNLELFPGTLNYAFFRFEQQFLEPDLRAARFTAMPSSDSVAVVEPYDVENPEANLPKFLEVNRFKPKKGELLDIKALKEHYETNTGVPCFRERQLGSETDEGWVPSLGYIAMFYLLTHLPDHKIVLVDFSFQGTDVHNWEAETEFARRLEKQGKLLWLLSKSEQYKKTWFDKKS